VTEESGTDNDPDAQQRLEELKFWFSDETPEELKAALQKRGLPSAETIINVQTDLTPDGAYGKGWIVLFKDAVVVAHAAGADCEISDFFRFEDITGLEAVMAVGGGTLEARNGARRRTILRFSNARARPIGLFAKKFRELRETGVLKQEDDDDAPKKCPDCGRVLEEDNTVCVKCLKKGHVVGRVIGYAKGFWPYMAIMVACMILQSLAEVLAPQITRTLYDGILSPTDKPEAFTMLRWGATLGMSPLVTVIAVMTALLALGVGCAIISEYASIYMGTTLVDKIRRELFDHVQAMEISFFDKFRTGVLISRIDSDTRAFERLLTEVLKDIGQASVMLVVMVVIMFGMNWKLALIALVPAPVLGPLSVWVFRRMMPIWHTLRERQARLTAILSDTVSGMRVVKAFAQENREIARFAAKSIAVRDSTMNVEYNFAIIFPILGLISQVGRLLVYFYGGLSVMNGSLTPGTLIAFIMYTHMFYGPFERLLRSNRWLTRTASAAQRIFEILDREPETDPEEVLARPETIKGEVEFRKVWFGYDPLKPVLKGLDLHVKPGEMIGLVGRSGVGKTTVTNLILNFYKADEGEILIDGIPLNKLHPEALRSQIGVVPQDCYLFNGTVAENIAYAHPKAGREEIIKAAIAANAHDFIMELPDGYDTNVGERGGRLSMGQRQRISIARAILHNPRILILDEATSSVDTDTENLIQEALARLVENRTTFAIAHRLSTLKTSDRLIVIKDGEIAEIGTHDELISMKGEYFRLIDLQSKMHQLVAVGG